MASLPIIFVSGLPRSGSTLLQNLLAQNPKHHCTATNDLLDIMMRVRDTWMTLAGFIAQGLKQIEPRVLSTMRGMIGGFYEQEFSDGKTVFDKSRGHLAKIELLESILGRPIKVVVPIRDLRDIIASFEKVFRKSSITDHPDAQGEQFLRLTVRGRAERLLSIEHTVGFAVECLQDAFWRGFQDRLVLVSYKELTHNPVVAIRRVCYECDLEPFTCDPTVVEQVTQENDTVYGMELHTVRPLVEPDPGDSWRGILPEDLANSINDKYQSIQNLVKQRDQWITNTLPKTKETKF